MKNWNYQILKTFTRSEQQQTNKNNEGERKYNNKKPTNLPVT